MSDIVIILIGVIFFSGIWLFLFPIKPSPSPFPLPPPPPKELKCPFNVGDMVNYKDSAGYDAMKVIAYKKANTFDGYIIRLEEKNGFIHHESDSVLEHEI